MRERTDIRCPLTGANLVYTGSTSNGLVHFYEPETNRGVRYKRYRLDWSILELSGGRFFHIDGSETVEVQKVGDRWLTLNATEEEKQKALDDYSARMRELMQAKFPTVKKVYAKLLSDDLEVVVPRATPPKELYLIPVYDSQSEIVVMDKNDRPNVSADECPLVEHITGRICEITEENMGSYQSRYEEIIRAGDVVYAWDMGGWGSLSGRAGDAIFRDNEYVASRLTKMS